MGALPLVLLQIMLKRATKFEMQDKKNKIKSEKRGKEKREKKVKMK